MTKPMIDLRALVEKSAGTDLLREMIGFAAERLMKLEVGAKTGADYGEKSSDRLAQRTVTATTAIMEMAETGDDRAQAPILTFMSGKGGAGKTVSLMTIVSTLSAREKKIAILEADEMRPITA